jgi:hypothetical protein
MTYPERELKRAAIILLNGITGVNLQEVSRSTGLCRATLHGFIHNNVQMRDENIETLYLFVWRRINGLEEPLVQGRRWGSVTPRKTEENEVIN